MADEVLCKRRFAIISAAGSRYQEDHHAGEMRERSLLRCVYLTRSIKAAVELQTIAKRVSIRVHRAADLAETLILLRITGARVVLVDLPVGRQNLQRFLHALECAWPQAAVVVVASEIDADRWEDVVRFGGFDMMLRPFSRQELTVVFDAADEYAARQLTPEARALRLAKRRSFVCDLVAKTPALSGSR
jgi:DNA-binding NtrC family response regulator